MSDGLRTNAGQMAAGRENLEKLLVKSNCSAIEMQGSVGKPGGPEHCNLMVK